jgi:hypothetical protein
MYHACTVTRLSPSPDGNGGIGIKTEAFLDVEWERDPVNKSLT